MKNIKIKIKIKKKKSSNLKDMTMKLLLNIKDQPKAFIFEVQQQL